MGLGTLQQPVRVLAMIGSRLDGVLGSVQQIGTSLRAIEQHMLELRGDIATLTGSVESLRAEVAGLDASVTDIRAATVALEGKVDHVDASLERIDMIARSVPGFRRRSRSSAPAGEGAQQVGHPPEES